MAEVSSEPHTLDRPVWSSLSGRQAHLAIGGPAALRIDPGYGPFIAARDRGDDAQAALGDLIRKHGTAAPIETEAWPAPPGCSVAQAIELVQMVADPSLNASEGPHDAVLLGEADAGAMRGLVALTEPGPWGDLSHRIGAFHGIWRGGVLVAMAGERMLPAPGFAEVSGVCTHPEVRGLGLAAGLIRKVAAGMIARGERPFLHADAANTGAIRLYEALGFSLRRKMVATILVADQAAD